LRRYVEPGIYFDGANKRLLELAEKDPKLAGNGHDRFHCKLWEGPQGERKAVIVNVGDRADIYRAYLSRALMTMLSPRK
jgi:hypothetical protein